MSKSKAYTYQRDLDVMGLADLLLSIESQNLQIDGWKFHTVLKSETTPIPKDQNNVSYTWLHINNKWNDRALFMRIKRDLSVKPPIVKETQEITTSTSTFSMLLEES
jgi:hypothetical protein